MWLTRYAGNLITRLAFDARHSATRQLILNTGSRLREQTSRFRFSGRVTARVGEGATLRIGHYGYPSIPTGDDERAGQKVRQPDRSHRQLAVPGMQGGEE
jgi:hypothetical protein